MLKFKNLQFHVLGTDTWYANLGPNHPLYHASEVTMEQLLPHPFVRLPDDYFSNLSFYLEIDGVRLEQFTARRFCRCCARPMWFASVRD